MSYKVKLQTFEGPFDLLVYLIENAEMSIYNIRISEITAQYLEYIKAMEERDVQVATEFMVLAASLIEIKSKMILPRMTASGETVIDEDPRTELVQKILEYKRYKAIAQMLEGREEAFRGVYEKPQEDISRYLDNPDEYLSLGIGEFAEAFNLFLSKKQRVESVKRHYQRVERERASMEGRISFILKSIRNKLTGIFKFKDLVKNKEDRYDVVITFVSLLEMAKERLVSVDQKRNFGEIQVAAGERIDDDSLLEKYHNQNVEEVNI